VGPQCSPEGTRRVRLLSVRPETMYAKSGGHFLAYQLVGEGGRDLVAITEMVSHCEHRWEEPRLARSLQRLVSFGRLILFDRRGTGLSDPVPVDRLPTLEERADDLAAVIDATGAERPVLLGFSEGGLDAMFFAATRPNRVSSLVLYGAFARFFATDDYPFGYERHLYKEFVDGVVEAWGTGGLLEGISPSMVGDERLRTWWAGYERLAASPGVAEALLRLAFDVDIREVLPLISSPTLILHRRDDVFSSIGHARYLADHIPGAELVELPGNDHPFFLGDADAVVDAIEEFVTGSAPTPHRDRVLATALFVDIVASTDRAVELGDRGWRDLLESHHALIRRQLDRFGGQEIDTAGDGLFAAFDGPARAVSCACAIRDATRALGIEVRSGVHTGECEMIDGKLGGLAVHVAARVAACAQPSEVLVSRTINDLVAGSGIRLSDRGTHTLKGIPDAWQLYSAEA
jgi:pimeloyl-ACP methyl ester carboxylesterase/class 3 adenylate cyclase